MASTEDLPVLYSFRRCPYAMRARMALLLTGQAVRLRELVLRDKPEEMLAVSPKGTVPVLVLPGGEVIDESLAVMTWAIAQSPGELDTPDNRALALIQRNDGSFKHDLDRYKYPSRYDDIDPLVHRARGAEFIVTLNSMIAANGQLAGRNPGFADFAIFPFVRQFRIADQAWFDDQDWPALHAWLDAHLRSEVFARAMTKFPLWKETGEEVLFGSSLPAPRVSFQG